MSKPKTQKTQRFECIDINDAVVKIRDMQQGVVADVYFKVTGTFCNTCKIDTCEHIDYALTVPKVKDLVLKKIKAGWNLPEPDP